VLEDPPVTFIPNVPRKIHGLLGVLLGAGAVMSPPLLSSGEVHVVENFSSILTGLQGAVQLEINFRSEGAVAWVDVYDVKSRPSKYHNSRLVNLHRSFSIVLII
jgi:hypothetical protein